jgi:parallel beta-helix repeat protein
MFEDQNSVLGRAVFEEKLLQISDRDAALHSRTARFIIGTSTSGWTAKDCHYLCDGTNDQEEINNAITALPATGGEVVILDGTYNITAKIDVTKDNVSIRGNGNATILKRMFDSSTAEGVITLTGRSGCKIADLQIDGNKTAYTANSNYGIYLSSSSDNTITGNTCNNSNHGIRFDSSSNRNIVTGNTCNSNSNGIRFDSSSSNTLTDNTCNNNSSNGIYLSSSSNNTIADNTCNNNYYGIFLHSSSDNTITGNTCNNNNNGIRLYASSNNNTVTGNTCNSNSDGIHLYASSRNTITSNTCIRGTGQTSDYASDQYTIRLRGTSSYNLISSNNCMGKAVVVEGGTGNSTWGNKFDDTDDLPI